MRKMNKQVDPSWYRNVFTLDVIDMPWAENIEEETQIVLDMLELSGHETILDLACGFGHHSLELARLGFNVVGVDISQQLIDYAQEQATQRSLEVEFLCADLRYLSLNKKFDVVLSLFDGAIGYFENEEENLKTFTVISNFLKVGGKHLMQIPNSQYARKYYPSRTWCQGSKMIEIMEYDWDEATHSIYALTQPIRYKEVFHEFNPIRTRQRAYDMPELRSILSSVNITLLHVYKLLDKEAQPSDESEYLSIVSTKVKVI
jgi:SAM-dependent methyltransferase